MSSNIIYKDREVKKFIFKLINQNTSLNSRVEKEVDVIFKNIITASFEKSPRAST